MLRYAYGRWLKSGGVGWFYAVHRSATPYLEVARDDGGPDPIKPVSAHNAWEIFESSRFPSACVVDRPPTGPSRHAETMMVSATEVETLQRKEGDVDRSLWCGRRTRCRQGHQRPEGTRARRASISGRVALALRRTLPREDPAAPPLGSRRTGLFYAIWLFEHPATDIEGAVGKSKILRESYLPRLRTLQSMRSAGRSPSASKHRVCAGRFASARSSTSRRATTDSRSAGSASG